MSKRGPYFKYFFDDSDIPKQTLHDYNNKRNKRKSDDTDTYLVNEDKILDISNENSENINSSPNFYESDEHPTQAKNEDENENENIIDVSDLLNENEDFNEVDLSAALLSMFFSCKLTQSAFVTVLQFSKILSKANIPKDFDGCAKILLKEYGNRIDFQKIWYCTFCNQKVNLSHHKQRACNICLKK